jgi:hypothetical protein
MNTVEHYNLHSMFETAFQLGKGDVFIREVFSTACIMMWYGMDFETEKYVEKCIQELRQHIEGGWDKDWKPKKAAP